MAMVERPPHRLSTVRDADVILVLEAGSQLT
jgi:ABC-type transport system involved in Fe-S cluster assembly fused permease/ATPase subunit